MHIWEAPEIRAPVRRAILPSLSVADFNLRDGGAGQRAPMMALGLVFAAGRRLRR
jgi:hypothetical protein